jgi:hypothetical protein
MFVASNSTSLDDALTNKVFCLIVLHLAIGNDVSPVEPIIKL